MDFVIETCLTELSEVSDKAIDWFIHYMNERDEAKKHFYYLMYEKYAKERKKLALKLVELTNERRRDTKNS